MCVARCQMPSRAPQSKCASGFGGQITGVKRRGVGGRGMKNRAASDKVELGETHASRIVRHVKSRADKQRARPPLKPRRMATAGHVVRPLTRCGVNVIAQTGESDCKRRQRPFPRPPRRLSASRASGLCQAPRIGHRRYPCPRARHPANRGLGRTHARKFFLAAGSGNIRLPCVLPSNFAGGDQVNTSARYARIGWAFRPGTAVKGGSKKLNTFSQLIDQVNPKNQHPPVLRPPYGSKASKAVSKSPCQRDSGGRFSVISPAPHRMRLRSMSSLTSLSGHRM